jgi:transposase
MTQNLRFVGIDVGKFEFHIHCLWNGLQKRFANTVQGHRDLIAMLGDERDMVLAVEPTGGCEWALWEALDTAGFTVRQVSAAHVRHFAQADGKLAKTDPVDAKMIARFMAFKPCAGRTLPAQKLRLLNVLVTKRNQLITMRKNLSCQIKQRGSTLVDDLDSEHMALLEAQIVHLDEQIQSAIQEDEDLAHKARCLRSVPGVGPVLTSALIAGMPELGSISDKQAAALIGVAPVAKDSGRYQGKRTIAGGRRWIRHILYQAALVASYHNPVLKAFADRLRKKGKPHKVVITAVARKLIAILNVICAQNRLWRQA